MNEEIVTFTNWSAEDFTAVWGGQEKLVKAGETIHAAKGVVDTFAYHLAVRELYKERGDKEMASFIEEYKRRAISTSFEAENAVEGLVEPSEGIVEEVVIEEAPKKKGKKAKVVEEEVFEGLEA